MTSLVVAPPEEKACRGCGEIKPLDGFAKKGKSRAARCKDCLREWAQRYRQDHSDRINANARSGYAKDPSKKKSSKAAYWSRSRSEINARGRERYARMYPLEPERWLSANARRKQRIKVAMNKLDRALSAAYRRAIRRDDCTYCGLRTPGDMHVDHSFPLAKGGTDRWWNLAQSCGPCNRHKHDRCGTWMLLRRGTRC
ncbi:HNH endonuclease [Streptomyces brevispora]|uniref:HNH endonuclease n=1 Tax=Streptomyces brevispora TaxID=887462 RepID=UPI002E2FED42|nr:HNH endonuclease signature motif containing protein [Streptomyces brevispora]